MAHARELPSCIFPSTVEVPSTLRPLLLLGGISLYTASLVCVSCLACLYVYVAVAQVM